MEDDRDIIEMVMEMAQSALAIVDWRVIGEHILEQCFDGPFSTFDSMECEVTGSKAGFSTVSGISVDRWIGGLVDWPASAAAKSSAGSL